MAFTWARVDAPTSGGQDVTDFVWDSGHARLVAVGTGGLVYTTPDGVTWTKQTAAAANSWRGVAYAPSLGTAGRLVAVSSAGTNRVMYSDDGGVTWTSASASAANGWQSVTWSASLALFVAVASSGGLADGTGIVMTSSDGITWAAANAINPRLQWQGVTWSPSLALFVAVSGGSVANCVMTSTNGTAWTRRNTPATVTPAGRSSGSCIQWSASAGKFAFESRNGTPRSVTTSPDGINWTEQTIPDNTGAVGGVQAVGASGLILFRQTGTLRVNTSPDGVTWTQVDPGVYHNWNASGYAPLATPFVVAWGDGSNTQMLTGTLLVLVAVPDVVNLTQAAATTAITGAGLTLGTVTTTWSETVAAGAVISSTPAAGTLVSPGSAVAIVVSTGFPVGVVMPGFPVLALCFEGFDDNGNPLDGGTLESFVGGLTVHLPTYTTSALNVANLNPTPLDGMGRASVYIPDGVSYKFILRNALGVIVRTEDNYSIPAVVPLVNPTEVPTGSYFPFGGDVAPTGYALCQGQAVSRSDWAALFAVIGTKYGVGDASTTFNLPNMQGRFPLGVATSGTGSTAGGSGGTIDHTHTGPSHTHTVAAHTHTLAHTHVIARDGWGSVLNVPGVTGRLQTGNASGAGADAQEYQATADIVSGAASVADTGSKALTTDAGGTAATGTANPPFLASHWIIKTGTVTGAP